MKPEVLLAELEKVAEALDVAVSYENLRAASGHGGLCRVKGEYRVIIDKRAGAGERAATLAAALGGLDWRADVEVQPAVREVVEYYAPRRAS